jgi:hypothetical protein
MEARPLLPRTPNSRTLTLREKHWFIRPELDISVHWNVGEGNVPAAMLPMALASRQVRYVGKPFKRWFWRRQITATP